jgi:hypothetical protein
MQGDTDPDVKELQKVLNADVDTVVSLDGTGSAGKESTYFGPATKAAVIKFQNKYRESILIPAGLTTGNGIVGKATRTKLNLLLGVMNTPDSVRFPVSRAGTDSSAGVVTVAPTIIAPATNNQMSICSFVQLLININVIAANKANTALSVLSCSNQPLVEPWVILKANGQADNLNIASAGNVTLSWTSSGVSHCTLNGDSTSRGTSGSLSVSVSSPVTRRITCTGNNGTASDYVNISVNNVQPAVSSTNAIPRAAFTALVSTTTASSTLIANNLPVCLVYTNDSRYELSATSTCQGSKISITNASSTSTYRQTTGRGTITGAVASCITSTADIVKYPITGSGLCTGQSITVATTSKLRVFLTDNSTDENEGTTFPDSWTYRWTFSNVGSSTPFASSTISASSTMGSTMFNFATSGTYAIGLRITDSYGAFSVASTTVTVPFGLAKKEIASIGEEEVAGSPSGIRELFTSSIDVDSQKQPHILTGVVDPYGFNLYDKIGKDWEATEPLVQTPPRGPQRPTLKIDANDRGWISGIAIMPKSSEEEGGESCVGPTAGKFGGFITEYYNCEDPNESGAAVDVQGGISGGIQGGVAGGVAGCAVGGAAAGSVSGGMGAPAGCLVGGVIGGFYGGAVGAIDGAFGDSDFIKRFVIHVDGEGLCGGDFLVGGVAGDKIIGGQVLGERSNKVYQCMINGTKQPFVAVQNAKLVTTGGESFEYAPPKYQGDEYSLVPGTDAYAVATTTEENTNWIYDNDGEWVGLINNISRSASSSSSSGSSYGTSLNPNPFGINIPDISSLGLPEGNDSSKPFISPLLSWFKKIIPYKGFAGNLAIDPFTVNNAWYMGTQPNNTTRFNSSGSQSADVGLNPLTGSTGEKTYFKIAPTKDGKGIWHVVGGGSYKEGSGYINSKTKQRVVWASNSTYDRDGSEMGDDGAYVSVGIDTNNPEVAYMASSYGGSTIHKGVGINIWDGTKLVFPSTKLFIVDKNASAYGNGVRRYAPEWTPAKGGGAFICWTSGGSIKMKYIDPRGSDFFGETKEITSGSRCTMATDSNGDVHMTYMDGNTVMYRKIITK